MRVCGRIIIIVTREKLFSNICWLVGTRNIPIRLKRKREKEVEEGRRRREKQYRTKSETKRQECKEQEQYVYNLKKRGVDGWMYITIITERQRKRRRIKRFSRRVGQ